MRGTALARAVVVVVAVSASFAVRAFVGLERGQPLRVEREVSVARQLRAGEIQRKFTDGIWNPNKPEMQTKREKREFGLGRRIWALREMSTEKLHEKITEGRRGLWEGRLDVFRRKPPNLGAKYLNKKQIARAKTVLTERRLEEEEVSAQARRKELMEAGQFENEDEFDMYLRKEGPVLTSTRDLEESMTAMTAWSQRPGKRQQNKRYGDATPKTFKRADWYYISPEERDKMAEDLKARRDQGEWKTLVEDTRQARSHIKSIEEAEAPKEKEE